MHDMNVHCEVNRVAPSGMTLVCISKHTCSLDLVHGNLEKGVTVFLASIFLYLSWHSSVEPSVLKVFLETVI